MKIEIEIPDAKFKPGDVVRLQESTVKTTLFLLIVQRLTLGRWTLVEEQNRTITRMEVEQVPGFGDDDSYTCAVQDGSVDAYENPIRSGTVLCFQREDVDENAVKVDWSTGIVPADTKEIFEKRWKEENEPT